MNRLIIIFLALLLMFTVGCAGPTRTPAKIKGVFIEGTSGGDAETLNWILAADSASFGYAGHTVDSLVTYDNEYRIQLRMAAKDVR
jgi:ABC-type oligopeptide transport system substrate-binding subunit